MTKLMVGTEFYDAIRNNDFGIVLMGVDEICHRLYDEWNYTQHESFEELLEVCKHRMYRAKSESPIENFDISYQIGILEGVVTTYSSLYVIEQNKKIITESIGDSDNYVIVKDIYEKGTEGITAKELLHKFDFESSKGALTTLLKSDTIEILREDGQVRYRLTRLGKECFEELKDSKGGTTNCTTV